MMMKKKLKPEREWSVALVEQYKSCRKPQQCRRREAAARCQSGIFVAAAAGAEAEEVVWAETAVSGGDVETSSWQNHRPPPLQLPLVKSMKSLINFSLHFTIKNLDLPKSSECYWIMGFGIFEMEIKRVQHVIILKFWGLVRINPVENPNKGKV